MGLFQLSNNIVQIDPNSLALPTMLEIWVRDKTKTKEKAYAELAYVYYFCDFKSPYQNIPEVSREQDIKKDFLKNEKWKPDALVLQALKDYDKFQETEVIRLLKAAKRGVEKLTKYFNEKDPDDKNYTSNLEKIGKIIESIDKLEEKVKKDLKSTEKIRGGGDILDRER